MLAQRAGDVQRSHIERHLTGAGIERKPVYPLRGRGRDRLDQAIVQLMADADEQIELGDQVILTRELVAGEVAEPGQRPAQRAKQAAQLDRDVLRRLLDQIPGRIVPHGGRQPHLALVAPLVDLVALREVAELGEQSLDLLDPPLHRWQKPLDPGVQILGQVTRPAGGHVGQRLPELAEHSAESAQAIEREAAPEEITHLLLGEAEAELGCGLVLQVVRLIDDQVAVRRQDAVVGQHVGEQERVVDDDDVRGFGLRPCPEEEALVAAMEDAAPGDARALLLGELGPDSLLIGAEMQLGPVARVRLRQPGGDLLAVLYKPLDLNLSG